MNKNLAIALGIGVIALFAGIMLVPALFPPATTGISVTFYDADGNVVWQESTELWPFAITHSGSVVSIAGVVISYTVSADAGDVITDVSVVGELVIGESSAKTPWDVPRTSVTRPLSSSLNVHTFDDEQIVLADLLMYPGSTDSIEYGWYLNFEVTLTVTAVVNDIATEDTWSGFVRARLYWQADTEEVSIEGTISTINFS